MGRRRVAALLACCFIFGSINTPIPANAEGAEATIVLKLHDVHAMVANNPLVLQSPPVLVNDVTMVPLRFIGDALGASTDWNGASQTVRLTNSSKTIQLTIDAETALVNSQPILLEQPAMIMNDTTMVPLRFIAEQLGQTVAYDNILQTITLSASVTRDNPTAQHEKLVTPTVDNLVPDPEAGKYAPIVTALISVAVDKKGNIFSLRHDANTGYMINKYNPEVPNTFVQYKVDGKFNFEYKHMPASINPWDGLVTNQIFSYADFKPTKLYYNPAVDRMYVLEGTIAYSFEPEVRVEAHPLTFISPIPMELRDTEMRLGNTYPSSMFETADGETFYWGGSRVIYSSQRGGGSQLVAKTYIEKTSKLISTAKDKYIYTYEMTTGIISMLDGNSLKQAGQASIEGALQCIGANGSFYVMTAGEIYKIEVDGQTSLLVKRDELKFNKGMYKGKGKGYEPTEFFDPPKILFGKMTSFTVDQHDNIILIDESSRMIRRINIYQE